MRTAFRNTMELIASFGATVITCTINMDQNKSDLALYSGGVTKENMKAKAKMSVKRQSLKIQTIENNRRPKLLEKMGRDLGNLYLWNQEIMALIFSRKEVRLCAVREGAGLGWQRVEGGEGYPRDD